MVYHSVQQRLEAARNVTHVYRKSIDWSSIALPHDPLHQSGDASDNTAPLADKAPSPKTGAAEPAWQGRHGGADMAGPGREPGVRRQHGVR